MSFNHQFTNSVLEHNYLTIPPALLSDVQDAPLAAGIYALVARLYLVYQEPVPLSAADVTRIDSSVSYGAARRAIMRLAQCGWFVEYDENQKHAYVPTWGRSRTGADRPWQIGLPMLGCPKHIVAVRVDRRLLDICMGRIEPHAQHPLRRIESYLTRALIGLRDVGAYALATAGFFASTPRLEHYGFIWGGEAQPLPGDAALLAVLSQLHLIDDQTDQELTPHGLRKLGIAQQPQADDSSTSLQPLFFMAPDLIGYVIGDLIGHPITENAKEEQKLSAAASGKAGIDEAALTMPGNLRDLRDLRDSTSLSPSIPDGGIYVTEKCQPQGDEQRETTHVSRPHLLPDTEAAKLLRAINARPVSIRTYAHLEPSIVRAAIAHAQARPGVRDIAAWAVHLLKDYVEYSWHIPQLDAANSSWTPEYIAELKAKYPGMIDDGLDCVSPRDTWKPNILQSTDVSFSESSTALLYASVPTQKDASTLTEQVRAVVRPRLSRPHWSILDQLEVCKGDHSLLLMCRTRQCYEAVIALVTPIMSSILSELGLPASLPVQTVMHSAIVYTA